MQSHEHPHQLPTAGFHECCESHSVRASFRFVVSLLRSARLKENQPIGPYNQPQWTLTRQFAETRVYVLPPWEVSLQTGWNAIDQKEMSGDGGDSGSNEDMPAARLQNRLTQEVEIGLPYRLQVDYEARGDNQGTEWRFVSQSVELRWALANWDEIPLNPTIFGEWKFRNAEADSYELKLLLSEDFYRWHWGANLFFEQQVGDQRDQERSFRIEKSRIWHSIRRTPMFSILRCRVTETRSF